MTPKAKEWLKQADYDLETAAFMAQGGRYFYAVFMCHLAIEKALKGLYQEKLQDIPPKTHNVIYLLNKIGLKPQDALGLFIAKLNEANITTRYPEDLDQLKAHYTSVMADQIIYQSRELLSWIKQQF